MKRATQALPLAFVAVTASTQVNTVVGTDPNLEGTTTITYSVCPTAAILETTLSSTFTACPGLYCNGGSPSVTLGPAQGGYTEVGYTTVGPNGESTVYETVFTQTCSTGGLAGVTYYITEACPCEASRASDYVPSGFSTTVATVLTKTCDTCAESETTITLTTPCATGPYATAGVTNTGGAPAATGAAAGGAPAGGDVGAAATGAGATGGAAPAASGATSGNSSSGAGSPGAGQSNAATTGGNITVSPPITPVGGNVASDVGQNPATLTGAAQKMDMVGFTISAAFAVLVGAAAWWL